ncbi:MAG: hypothetical protein EOL87_03630 [Spartobacteria bacterium]|nr:hypothetical protein [Spartobacteria bacterium]
MTFRSDSSALVGSWYILDDWVNLSGVSHRDYTFNADGTCTSYLPNDEVEDHGNYTVSETTVEWYGPQSKMIMRLTA